MNDIQYKQKQKPYKITNLNDIKNKIMKIFSKAIIAHCNHLICNFCLLALTSTGLCFSFPNQDQPWTPSPLLPWPSHYQSGRTLRSCQIAHLLAWNPWILRWAFLGFWRIVKVRLWGWELRSLWGSRLSRLQCCFFAWFCWWKSAH